MGVGVVAVEEVGKEIVLEDGSKFECVSKFCYLGDMLTAAGGVAEASIVRTRCAWKQFRNLISFLGKRGVSLKLKGKLYRSSVQCDGVCQ